MSELDDIFGRQYDKSLLVKIARPMKQEIKDLFTELVGRLQYTTLGGDNPVVNADALIKKIQEL